MVVFSKQILTRDNLRKRGIPKPLECNFCKEIESVKHLFFDCLVARLLWDGVSDIIKVDVRDYESIASKRLCNKRITTQALPSALKCTGRRITRQSIREAHLQGKAAYLSKAQDAMARG